MLPRFEPASGNLPPGVHEATWDEFVTRYGYNAHRGLLLVGLQAALETLRAAGCRRAYIDGSFITAKEAPGDFDGCWEVEGVDFDRLDPVLRTFVDRRRAQKEKYGGELFPADWTAAAGGTNFLRFFQRDRETGQLKGIVAIDLSSLP